MLSVTATRAQILEFAENKGQWNSKVTFSCDMGNMAFFLEKQGYTVLMNDSADFKAIAEYYSGHDPKFNGNNGTITYYEGKGTIPKNKLVTPRLGLHSHAYEVIFPGSNPNPVIIPDKPNDSYNNYYIGKDPSKWASHARVFQAVTYKDVYPNIDVRYYTSNGTLKYDIIINPGGDISKVALQINGADGLAIKNGNLVIKTSVGNVTELEPYAYQVSKVGKKTVDAKFAIAGNKVYFKTGVFSTSATLVIDPTLIFASLTKSLADNWGYTATYDADGNFYAGGIVFGNGFPTANGPSYQPNFAGGVQEGQSGGYDVSIIKLDTRGRNKLYATYLGGGGDEQPHSMIVDKDGDLIVAGRTNSSKFPTTQDNFGPGGGYDIFISKFSPDGSSLVASRTIGGSGDDGVNIADKEKMPGAIDINRNYGDDARSEVIVDGAGNIYLASCTQSKDAKVTDGVFQPAPGGMQDGLLLKADGQLNVTFCSFLGGKGQDAAFVLALNPLNNDIYIAGATTSTDLKGTGVNAAGILRSTYGAGASDGFVTIISNDGTTQKSTVYVGGPGNDMVYGIQFDKFGYPYIMGTTTVAFPVTGNVGFKDQAGGRQFITKLSRGLTGVEYSTNFGKTATPSVPDISPVAFLVDRCENVYVSGWGGGINVKYGNSGTAGLSTYAKNPSDILKKNTDNEDFYFFVLEKNAASQLYGSYYGEQYGPQEQDRTGDHVDGGTSRFDRNGIIYQAICANCLRTPNGSGLGFPVSGNVWGPKNVSGKNSSGCNEAAVKIAFELAGIATELRTSINGVPKDTSGCIPLTVDFIDTIHRAKQYRWNFGDGTPEVVTTGYTQQHTYTQIGNYTARLIAIDSESCNIADTAYVHIRARSDYADIKLKAVKLLPCDSINYMFINQSTPPPGKPFSTTALEWDFGDGARLVSNADTVYHNYSAQGAYSVVLRLNDTNYCNSPDADSIKLRIATNVKAQFNIPAGCAPYTAVVNNTSFGGQQFYWNFGDGGSSTDADPVHLFADAGTYTVGMRVTDSSTCNITDTATVTVTIGAKPKAGYTFTPAAPIENEPFTFINTSTGATRYRWEFGDGDTLVTNSLDTPVIHQYNASGMYEVCLYVSTDMGCLDTSCLPINALTKPLVDVPNALSPNGDGHNDRIHVRGFGISKMDWKIYNRWGQLVFQSTSPSIGWDGYYKGVLQPQDVYTYVLNIIFTDNRTYQKKGDITLLR